MGFLSRLLVPRSVRRATHPVRTAKRAVTPKAVKKVQRSLHPIARVHAAFVGAQLIQASVAQISSSTRSADP
jgi:hypothetical protein